MFILLLNDNSPMWFICYLFVLIKVCKELYCNFILPILQLPMYLNNIVSRDILRGEKKEYGVYQYTYMFNELVQLCKSTKS